MIFSAPEKCDLLRHKQTKKHESNVATAKKSTKVTQFFSKANETDMHFSKKVATAELQLAGFIVEHELPFAAANHLVEIVKKIGQLHLSVQKGITMKRTKATYTIVEGIGREDIIDVLKNQTFSILLDESTDVSVIQMLALVVRYVNANTMQTVDRCFDIIKVLDRTSLELFKAVSNVLFKKHSIPPKKSYWIRWTQLCNNDGQSFWVSGTVEGSLPPHFCKWLHLSQFGIVFIPCFQEIACLD